MHIAKLHHETGLIPAGRYFQKLAANLHSANERGRARDAQDRETCHRSASAARFSDLQTRA